MFSPYLQAQRVGGFNTYTKLLTRWMRFQQALKHALKEDSGTYGINHSLLKWYEGNVESTHLYTVIFLTLVEPEVVQQRDTRVKAPVGFSPLSQWGQRRDSRYWKLLSSPVIYLADPKPTMNS